MSDRGAHLRNSSPTFRGVIATAGDWRIALAAWRTCYLLQCRLDGEFWETICRCPTSGILADECFACIDPAYGDADELRAAALKLPDLPADCVVSNRDNKRAARRKSRRSRSAVSKARASRPAPVSDVA